MGWMSMSEFPKMSFFLNENGSTDALPWLAFPLDLVAVRICPCFVCAHYMSFADYGTRHGAQIKSGEADHLEVATPEDCCNSDLTCPICLDKMDERAEGEAAKPRKLVTIGWRGGKHTGENGCGHCFHADCLNEVPIEVLDDRTARIFQTRMGKMCPICRKPFTEEQLLEYTCYTKGGALGVQLTDLIEHAKDYQKSGKLVRANRNSNFPYDIVPLRVFLARIGVPRELVNKTVHRLRELGVFDEGALTRFAEFMATERQPKDWPWIIGDEAASNPIVAHFAPNNTAGRHSRMGKILQKIGVEMGEINESVQKLHFANVKTESELEAVSDYKLKSIGLRETVENAILDYYVPSSGSNLFKFLDFPIEDATIEGVLELGADIDHLTDGGLTLVQFAAQAGNAEALAMLLNANADPSAVRVYDGVSPVFMAAENGHANTLALLLEADADPSAAPDGNTPMYIAAQRGDADVLALLLEAKADPSPARTDGVTPMYLAAQRGDADVIALLLEAGADPSVLTNSGATPVFIAAQNGNVDALAALLEAKADFSSAFEGTISNWTPRKIAHHNGHEDVVAMLEEHERKQTQAVVYNGHPYDRIINALEGKWYSKGGLNVPHLRELLAVNGKSTEGSRADLQERLEELMNRAFTPAGRAHEPRRGVRAAFDAKYGDGSFARGNLQEGDITEVRPGVFEGKNLTYYSDEEED
jgi:ankyrin repeat protein